MDREMGTAAQGALDGESWTVFAGVFKFTGHCVKRFQGDANATVRRMIRHVSSSYLETVSTLESILGHYLFAIVFTLSAVLLLRNLIKRSERRAETRGNQVAILRHSTNITYL